MFPSRQKLVDTAPTVRLISLLLVALGAGSPLLAGEPLGLVHRAALPEERPADQPNRAFALGHFDADGVRDLVIVRGEEGDHPDARGEIVLHLGQNLAADPKRTPWSAPQRIVPLGFSPDLLAIGDLDRDGHDDVVVTRRGASTWAHLPGLGRGRLGAPRLHQAAGPIDALAVGPLDLPDGDDDLVLAIRSPDGPRLDVFAGHRSLLGSRPESLLLMQPATDLLLADISGDPALDLVVTTANGLILSRGRLTGEPAARGLFELPEIPSVLQRSASESTPFDLADAVGLLVDRFDGDGLDDVLVLPRWGAPALLATRGTPTIVVNSTADTPDSNTGDGVCNTGSGACTLRAAIQTANANPGADDISFSLDFGNWVLTVASPLPSLSTPMTIDASGLPFGFTIDGVGLPSEGQADGLRFSAGSEGSLIRSLNVRNFPGSGLDISAAEVTVVGGSYSGNGHCCFGTPGIDVDAGDVTIGGTTSTDRNLIGGHDGDGIEVQSTADSGVVIRGNWIGLGLTGLESPNNIGIRLGRAATVGGADPGAGNIVSGNDFSGIYVEAPAFVPVIQGNIVGLSPTGDSAVPNGGDGLHLAGGVLVPIVGGTAGNTLSGNGGNGLRVALNTVDDPVDGATIFGNRIGTDPTGTTAFPNTGAGVRFRSATDVNFGPGNVVSGNTAIGILVDGENFTGDVHGNLVGTSADGTSALPNGSVGLHLDRPGYGDVTIGGLGLDEGNIFAGNLGSGIELQRPVADNDDVFVYGNLIGVGSDGSALGNGGDGIRSVRSYLDVRGNEIAHNAGHGFSANNQAFNVRFQENSIHDNGMMAIDIGDDDVPTPNDGSSDLVPSNYPDLQAVTLEGATSTVTGTLTAVASTSYRVDVFANAACDASGHGEATRLIHSANVATDAQGSSSFSLGFTSDLAADEIVTTQATRLGAISRSSELSACSFVWSALFADGFESGDTSAW